MSTKLDTKDLIYTGAFTAIYIVVRFVIIMTLGLVPVFYLILPLFAGAVCATVYMMYVTKIQKRYAITIFATLYGVILVSTGHFYSVLLCIPIGMLAEAIAKIGNYKSTKTQALSFLVFNLTMVTSFGQLYLSQSTFVESARASYGDQYASLLSELLASYGNYMLLIQCTSAVVGAAIGLVIAKFLFKKHFKEAGIV